MDGSAKRSREYQAISYWYASTWQILETWKIGHVVRVEMTYENQSHNFLIDTDWNPKNPWFVWAFVLSILNGQIIKLTIKNHTISHKTISKYIQSHSWWIIPSPFFVGEVSSNLNVHHPTAARLTCCGRPAGCPNASWIVVPVRWNGCWRSKGWKGC